MRVSASAAKRMVMFTVTIVRMIACMVMGMIPMFMAMAMHAERHFDELSWPMSKGADDATNQEEPGEQLSKQKFSMIGGIRQQVDITF